ncbi:MAG: phosphonopyruvate decarboxylase [Gracilimonas sp.]
MLKPSFLYELLKSKGIGFSLGVPDSLLKDYCSYAFDNGDELIAANEGGAVAIAAGYHLATGEIPLVYMQNSGFGNIINPVTSLVDEEVYSIPMLLMVGWRGQPGKKDEPQHIKQGRTMEAQLKALELPYAILSTDEKEAGQQVDKAFKVMQENQCAYVLLVPPKTFEPYALKSKQVKEDYSLKREEALKILMQALKGDEVIVSTTGKTSRELFELREKFNQGHEKDFLTVGSMGHASQIALGIALSKPERRVLCIDGDGAVIMHMGSLAIIGEQAVNNFKHVIINNGAHESVGGQPTAGFGIDFGCIAKGCGYKKTFRAEDADTLSNMLPEFMAAEGPVLLEIMTMTGARKDLGRPTIAPVDNKKDFMNFLKH